ncbi:MAG: DNA polymerase I [Ruminococcus sp.]|jgi:DNA polymerase-1|nr:DNA polymerase I [Ruminococcus sp.]
MHLYIDGNSIMYRAYYGIKALATKDGVYTNAVLGFLNIFMSISKEINPDRVVAAFDRKEPTFRHLEYAEYKAGRKPMPQELISQMPLIKEILTAMGIKTLEFPGFEADDILGTLSRQAEENSAECVILSGDADTFQLIDTHTRVFKPSNKGGFEIYDTERFTSEYSFPPVNMIDLKALMGDASDNIPGVRGIGEKTAKTLISEYITIENLYKNIDSVTLGKASLQKLKDGQSDAEKSKWLATINCSVPGVNLSEITPPVTDTEKLSEILTRLQMFKTLEKLGGKPVILKEPETETETPEVNYTISDFREIKEVSYFLFDGETLRVAAGDKLCKTTNTAEIKEYLESEYEKITFGSKNVYKYGFEHNIIVRDITADVNLSGYLLDTNAAEYTIEKLCAAYNTRYRTDVPDEYKDTASLPAITQKLKSGIENSEMNGVLEKIELPLSETLGFMEYTGVCVDGDGIREFGVELTELCKQKEAEIYKIAGEQFNISSPKQVGEILFEKMGLPHGKKGKNGAYSTSIDVLETLRKYPPVDDILEYRTLSKLNSTYVEGLLKCIKPDGRIHSTFNQTETRTGRISSVEPNLQNIPVRTDLGRRMRKFFTAPDGSVLIDADYSQIELRILAHMSRDEQMIQDFNSGVDIHTAVASQVFGLPAEMITAGMRRTAKAVNFGIVYGIGAFSLSKDIGVSVKEAEKYINNYFNKYSGVKRFMDDTERFAEENHYVKTLYGRKREIPELLSANKNIRNFGLRAARNAPIQGTAADIIKIAMVKVFNTLKNECPTAKLILQIHDELILECPERNAVQASKILGEQMANAANLDVPLIADVHCAKTWYDAKE